MSFRTRPDLPVEPERIPLTVPDIQWLDGYRVPGVYVICRADTGRAYVGLARDIRSRWYVHRTSLRVGRHDNPHLQADYDAVGEGAFWLARVFQAHPRFLEDDHSLYQLLARVEGAWVRALDCTLKGGGYNSFRTVEGGSVGPDPLVLAWVQAQRSVEVEERGERPTPDGVIVLPG